MQKRIELIIIFTLFFTLIVFSIGFISATSCDVRLRTQCQTDPWDNVVMGISAATNAHGQLNGQTPTYDYVLCCDFSGNSTCTGTNEILGLSTLTNAHAESPYGSYNNPICYGNLECDDVCDTLFTMPVLSLSAPTNAHLANFSGSGSYTTKICCKTISSLIQTCSLKNSFWSKDEATLAPITSGDDSVMEGTQVKLVVEGDNCGNDQVSVSFEVREDDPIGYDPVTTNPNSVWFNSGKAVGKWKAEWQNDGIGDPEYYFIATIISQDKTINSKDKGPLLTVTEQGTFCDTINICSDYPDAVVCESDSSLCDVAPNSAPSGIDCNDPLTNCDCSWNTGTSSCEFVSTSGAVCGNNVIDVGEHCDGTDWGDFTPNDCFKFGFTEGGTLSCIECKFNTVNCTDGFGSCGNNKINKGETCDGTDFGQITGCQDFNEFNNIGTLSCNNCQFNTSLCVGGPGWDINKPSGTCRYSTSTDDDCSDGYLSYTWTAIWEGTGEKPSWCQDGSRVYKCPAQAKLPFFNVYSLIGAIVLIALIYLVLTLKKKKMKLKKVSSKRKRKGKR